MENPLWRPLLGKAEIRRRRRFISTERYASADTPDPKQDHRSGPWHGNMGSA